jgi:hypothetical protein
MRVSEGVSVSGASVADRMGVLRVREWFATRQPHTNSLTLTLTGRATREPDQGNELLDPYSGHLWVI